MKSFFKVFFASLVALVVFSGLCLVLCVLILVALTLRTPTTIYPHSVLVVDLTRPLSEQDQNNPLNRWLNDRPAKVPGLFSTVRIIRESATDKNIDGIYLKLGDDPNGMATGQELRDALLAFRKSGKFILAYGDDISQKAYYVSTAATRIYLNPVGNLEFRGFAVQEIFFKGLLDKLEIHPQIFYDGKFKSATEPLRVDKMTEPNRVQTAAFLGDEYSHFLEGVAKERNLDSATLATYANDLRVRTANDALTLHLVDGLRYDDQVMTELRRDLNSDEGSEVRFVSTADYQEAGTGVTDRESGKVAVIYAEGDIVDGKAPDDELEIAADDYVSLIRRVREDASVRAIVLRVNSPGGSALAAEKIWRELELAKATKPVVVSMGDYAASGGYYISCEADSIFADPQTLTGSIGVFAIIPDLSSFFQDKLGITFDEVKTANYADLGTEFRPLTPGEKKILQGSVDTTYAVFKSRVTMGRNLGPSFVDSIAQGRVWTGAEAVRLRLVDRLGDIGAAIRCAAGMAHLRSFDLVTYPEPKFDLGTALSAIGSGTQTRRLKEALGDEYPLFEQIRSITRFKGEIQARLPCTINIE